MTSTTRFQRVETDEYQNQLETSPHSPPMTTNGGRRFSQIPRKPLSSSYDQVIEITEENPSPSPTPPKCSESAVQQRKTLLKKRWRPIMLRWIPAIALILICLAIVAALEILRYFDAKYQGFSAENKTLVNLIRYLPTVIVIGLGFVWKSLVRDLKLIAPFSAMDRRWTSTSKSLLLDYIDPLDIVSVWKSARSGHWAVFLGLVGGLLSGFLVPLASSLTFVDLSSPVSNTVNIKKSEEFSFQNTLADNNGSLIPTLDYRASQPYASILSSRQPSGQTSPWTVENYAYESYDVSNYVQKNATVEVATKAFDAPFDCVEIGYTFVPLSSFEQGLFIPVQRDIERAGCVSYVLEAPASVDNYYPPPSTGWLNVTDCSSNGTDIRLLATVADMTTNKTMGLLCRPKYYLQDAKITVNASTSTISAFTIENGTAESVLPADLPVMYMYLNDPMDRNSQYAWLTGHIQGPHTTVVVPQATFANVTQYSLYYPAADPFFTQLYVDGRTANDYIAQPDLLKTEVTDLIGLTISQVVNAFSKVPSQGTVLSGLVDVYDPRILIRSYALRAMEGILAVMSLIVLLCLTILRPRAYLVEDPSSLAASCVFLGNSGDQLGNQAGKTTLLDIDATEEALAEWQWRLTHGENNAPVIEGRRSSLNASTPLSASPQKEASVFHFTGPEMQRNSQHVNLEDLKYQPVMFRWASRIGILASFCIVVAGLAVLLRFSNSNNGFPVSSSAESFAWTFVPSTILVLLGYSLAGIDAVLTRISPFLALRTISGSGPLLYRPDRDPFTAPFSAILKLGSIALATSSISIIAFPAVKIVAAGLFLPIASSSGQEFAASFDNSLISNFELVNESATDAVVQSACQFAEWTRIPDFGVVPRAGALQNLIFSNLTDINLASDVELHPESEFEVRIPGIMVDVNCTSFGPEDIQTIVIPGSDQNILFEMICNSTKCKEAGVTLGMNFMSTPFSGIATIPNYGLDQIGPGSYDSNFQVELANFTGVVGPLQNFSSLDSEPQLTPGLLNLSTSNFPQMSATTCSRQIWEVEVNTTFTRTTRTTLNGSIPLPWSPSRYDPASISQIRRYNTSFQISWYPPPYYSNQYATDYNTAVMNSDSLFPSRASTTNFFELIAVYAQYQLGDVNKLMTRDGFETAVQAMYTAYLVELITEMRAFAGNGSFDTSSSATTKRADDKKTQITITGTLSSPTIRMKQDQTLTIVICALLATMSVGLGWIFWSFPRRTGLSKAPSSIIARMEMVSGSKVVGELRREEVLRSGEWEGWEGRRWRLGWWDDGGRGEGRRWGVDFVDGVGVGVL